MKLLYVGDLLSNNCSQAKHCYGWLRLGLCHVFNVDFQKESSGFIGNIKEASPAQILGENNNKHITGRKTTMESK